MTQRIETRAARLVTALQKAGHQVKRLRILGDEIQVDLVEPQEDDYGLSLVSMKRGNKPRRTSRESGIRDFNDVMREHEEKKLARKVARQAKGVV
eukprot:m.262502 g.262502  ORF g.262502 m.262502 type:complete len:95 (+) comp49484_c0_seq1:262-546(+)